MSVYQRVLVRKRVLATSSTDSFTQVARALFFGDSELWLCAESQIQPNKTYWSFVKSVCVCGHARTWVYVAG